MAKSKELELAIKIAGKVDKSLTSAINSVSKQIGGVTKTVGAATAAAAAAVGAIATASVNVGKEFETAMSQVQATMLLDKSTEEGAKQFEILENAARECGRTTAFSATEAAEGLNYLALAGYSAEEAAVALPTVLRLAGAGAMDLAEASDMVTDSMSALGIAATETNLNSFADKMAMAASKSNTSVQQLGEAILAVGGTAKDLAGGTTELDAALGVLADSGIKAAEGGTHLRNMILALQNPRNAQAATLMKQLGVSAYDAEGNMRSLGDVYGDINKQLSTMNAADANKAIATIFKQTDLASARAMLAATADSVESLGTVMDSALSESGKSMQSLGIDLTSMAKSFKSTTTQEQFAAQMLQQYGMTAEESGVLFSGLQSIISGTGSRFDELSAAISNSKGAAEDMYNIQLDNLEGDIAKFQSGLADLGISIYQDINSPLRDTVQLGTDLIAQLSEAYAEGGLDAMVGEVGSCLSEILAVAGDYAPQLLNAGMNLLKNLLQGVLDNADSIGATMAELATDFVTGTASMLPQIIEAGILIFEAFINAMLEGDNLAKITETAVTAIGAFINTIINHLPELISAGKEIITQLITGILSGTDGSFGDTAARIGILVFALQPLLGLFGGLSGIMSGITGVIGTIGNLFGSLGAATGAAAPSLASLVPILEALTTNALGLIALGGGFLLIGGGMALIAHGAVEIANAGPGAAAAFVLLAAAVAGMAIGAAALAPALTAGAVGLAAFGAGVALIGVGILAATSGIALLASQLPNIATYGAAAAVGIIQISTALVMLAAGAVTAAGGLSIMFLPMVGGAATTAALGLALIGLNANLALTVTAVGLLTGEMVLLNTTMKSIKKNAAAAGESISGMADGVDIISTGLNTIQEKASNALDAFVSLFEGEAPNAAAAAGKLADGINNALNQGWAKARSDAAAAAKAIKSAFEGLNITIPKPKIPTITTTYKEEKYGEGGKVKLPQFQVHWNALGGIFDNPAIMNTPQGLQGAGEKGPEALLPLDTLWMQMRSMIQEAIRQASGQSIVEALINKLQGIDGGGGTGGNPEPAFAGGYTVNYSPQYNLYGTATKEDAVEAERLSQAEFNKMMKQWQKNNNRTKF